ncbi:putative peptidoglycan-binding domain-containing protein [Desulfovibrio piger]
MRRAARRPGSGPCRHPVQHRPRRCPRILQRAVNACGLGIAVDGKIGPATITAIRSLEDDGRLGDLLRAQAAERLYYYKTRPGWPVYGRGWQARTQRCFDTCRAMLGGE